MGPVHHAKLEMKDDTVHDFGIKNVSGATKFPQAKIQLLYPEMMKTAEFLIFFFYSTVFLFTGYDECYKNKIYKLIGEF